MKIMKKLLLLFLIVFITFSCSKEEDNIPDRDVIVLNSTTFISEGYEVEKGSIMGADIEGTETRMNVISFNEEGQITYFTVDAFDNIIGVKSDRGVYSLEYPEIKNILAVNIFSENEITIKKDGNDKMYFNAGGLRYEPTLSNFN